MIRTAYRISSFTALALLAAASPAAAHGAHAQPATGALHDLLHAFDGAGGPLVLGLAAVVAAMVLRRRLWRK